MFIPHQMVGESKIHINTEKTYGGGKKKKHVTLPMFIHVLRLNPTTIPKFLVFWAEISQGSRRATAGP